MCVSRLRGSDDFGSVMHMITKRLYRSRDDRVIAGIFGGLGQYFNVDPVLLRLIYLVVMIVTAVIPAVIVYLLAIIIVPLEPEKPGAAGAAHAANEPIITPPPSSGSASASVPATPASAAGAGAQHQKTHSPPADNW